MSRSGMPRGVGRVVTAILVVVSYTTPAAAQGNRPPAGAVPAAGRALAWPAPPEPARIRFIRTIDPLAVRGKRSFLSRMWRAFIGSRDEPVMEQPYGIAVGPDRKVYVADTFGHAIHVYDLARPGYSSIRVDGDSLIGVAIAAGRLFVTDSATGRLICMDEKGHVAWTRGRKDGFERPTGVAAGPDRVYVVDTTRHCVTMVGLAGEYLGAFGDHGDGPGQFNFPTNITRRADGRLYVTDTMNFRVQIFDPEGQYLGSFGRLGDGAGDFDKPKGIAVDSGGHVYVVEGLGDKVQIFDDRGRLLLAFGESGSGDGQFWLPSGITIADDLVYVADSANRRVQMFQYLKAGK